MPAAGQLRLLADNAPTASELPVQIPVTVPDDAGRLIVCVWDRFAKQARRLIDEAQPQSGARSVQWDGANDDGQPVRPGEFLVRVTVDGHSESQIVRVSE